MTDDIGNPIAPNLTLPIVNGYIKHPLSKGVGATQRKLWCAYMHRDNSRVFPVKNAFLAKEDEGSLIDASTLVTGAAIGFSAEEMDEAGEKWEKNRLLFMVVATSEYSLTLKPITERQVPYLAKLDVTNHPCVLQIMDGLQEVQNYTAHLQGLLKEMQKKELEI